MKLAELEQAEREKQEEAKYAELVRQNKKAVARTKALLIAKKLVVSFLAQETGVEEDELNSYLTVYTDEGRHPQYWHGEDRATLPCGAHAEIELPEHKTVRTTVSLRATGTENKLGLVRTHPYMVGWKERKETLAEALVFAADMWVKEQEYIREEDEKTARGEEKQKEENKLDELVALLQGLVHDTAHISDETIVSIINLLWLLRERELNKGEQKER